ncbi:MAG: tRNA (N6-isopentenyl adenosine(37)-C2)-methylthiotransferase MiaB [Candidatus Ratteibacteria bacterium]
MTFYIKTYGCQMNDEDSRRLSALMQKEGHIRVSHPDSADIISIIACSVRKKAEDRAIQFARSMKPYALKGAIVSLLGCTAELLGEKALEIIPHASIICGPNKLSEFPSCLLRAKQGERPVLVGEGKTPFLPGFEPTEISASISVTKGCENFCTYCIVPFARGAFQSRPREEILCEISTLAKKGVKEILLLGQNVNEYGQDKGDGYGFAQLLSDISDIPSIIRIRFMTSHPKDTTEEILSAMAELPKVCNHLHLPVQSGSDKILTAMGRHYTRDHYLHLVSRARDLMPGIAITSDIIVGFPGEEKKDFEETCSLIKKVRFDELYIFKYSARKQSPAFHLPDSLSLEEKEARHQKVLSIQKKISREIFQEFEGKRKEVLVEKVTKNGKLMGKISENKTLVFEGSPSLRGSLVELLITGFGAGSLYGKIIS